MVWHCFHERVDTRSENEILSMLADAGLTTVPFTDRVTGAGIVFFRNITQDLLDFLFLGSNNGNDRVLAVSLGKEVPSASVWSLVHAGASDVALWDDPERRAREICLRFDRWNAVDDLLESPLVADHLVGSGVAWKNALRQVVEVARFTDASVLIAGESGTGKELVAGLIHSLDRRDKKRDLVVVDCTTIVPGLSGSEFFGHERGAFTGATSSRDGAFALADGGTLFLDEVGELPLELQAQLLRVVQERYYKRVGGNNWLKTEFRLICATNRDLLDEVKKGRFRHDLYYRIAGWQCRLPSLSERREDVIPLARHFIRQFSPYEKPPELDTTVEDYLVKREYPGNVRDLKQLVTRIMYRHVGKGVVTVGDIPCEERPSGDSPDPWWGGGFEYAIRRALLNGVGLKEIGRIAEDTAVDIAVNAEEGNLQRAAKRLGVTDRALQLRRAARQAGVMRAIEDAEETSSPAPFAVRA